VVSFVKAKMKNPFLAINNIDEILQMLSAGVRSENLLWAQNNGAEETVRRLYSTVDKHDTNAFLQFFGLIVFDKRLRTTDDIDRHAYKAISDSGAYPIFEDILRKSELKRIYNGLTDLIFCRRCSKILYLLKEAAKDLGCLEEYNELVERK
jgi:hypothetical protein